MFRLWRLAEIVTLIPVIGMLVCIFSHRFVVCSTADLDSHGLSISSTHKTNSHRATSSSCSSSLSWPAHGLLLRFSSWDQFAGTPPLLPSSSCASWVRSLLPITNFEVLAMPTAQTSVSVPSRYHSDPTEFTPVENHFMPTSTKRARCSRLVGLSRS